MKTLIARHRRLAVGAALLVACAGPASADPLSGGTVDFTNGQGTLTGFFQLDTTLGTVTNWDLTTSAFNCGNQVTCESSGFPQIEYTPTNSSSSIGFSFGAQGIFFTDPNVFGSASVLSFVLDCGGNNNDCIGTAALGSSIPLITAGESRAIVPIARGLSLASLAVTDPPGVLSFNVVSRTSSVPEPGTLALLGMAFAGLAAARKRRA